MSLLQSESNTWRRTWGKFWNLVELRNAHWGSSSQTRVRAGHDHKECKTSSAPCEQRGQVESSRTQRWTRLDFVGIAFLQALQTKFLTLHSTANFHILLHRDFVAIRFDSLEGLTSEPLFLENSTLTWLNRHRTAQKAKTKHLHLVVCWAEFFEFPMLHYGWTNCTGWMSSTSEWLG